MLISLLSKTGDELLDLFEELAEEHPEVLRDLHNRGLIDVRAMIRDLYQDDIKDIMEEGTIHVKIKGRTRQVRG